MLTYHLYACRSVRACEAPAVVLFLLLLLLPHTRRLGGTIAAAVAAVAAAAARDKHGNMMQQKCEHAGSVVRAPASTHTLASISYIAARLFQGTFVSYAAAVCRLRNDAPPGALCVCECMCVYICAVRTHKHMTLYISILYRVHSIRTYTHIHIFNGEYIPTHTCAHITLENSRDTPDSVAVAT